MSKHSVISISSYCSWKREKYTGKKPQSAAITLRYGTEIDQVSNLLQQLTKDKNKTKLSNLQKPATFKT